MANFGYSSMKAAMQSNRRVGNWKDTPVFACTKSKLPEMRDDVFYIVFDDENALVRDGKKYGRVTPQGDVREFNSPVDYDGFKREQSPQPQVSYDFKNYESVKVTSPIPPKATAAVGELEMNLAQIEKDIQSTLNGIKMDDIFKELEKFDFGI